MVEKSSVLRQSFDWHITGMKIFGLWKSDFMSDTFFKLYAFLIVSLLILPGPLMVFVKMYMVGEKDLEKITDSGFVALELIIIPMKVLAIFVNYDKFKSQIDCLDEAMFNSFEKDQIEIAKLGAKKCQQVQQFFLVTVVFACISWGTAPLLDIENRALPFDVYLPYDIKDHIGRYIATYLYCIIGAYISAFTNSVLDTLVPGFIIHATTQIKILKDKLQFLDERAEKVVSKEILTETQKATIKSDVIYETIVQCVEHHGAIFNYVKDIQSTFAPMVFLQFATSVFVICISTLEMTMYVIIPKMGEKSSVLRQSLDWHVTCMKIVGLWKSNFMSDTFFKLYALFMFSLIQFLAPLMVFVKMYLVGEKNLEKIIDSGFVALDVVIIPVKALTIFVNYAKFKNQIGCLDEAMFNSFEKDQIEIAKLGAKECRLIHNCFSIVVAFACIAWATAPFFDITNRTLPLDIYLPYDIKEHIGRYIATYSYCVLSAYTGALTNTILDSLIPGFIIHATTQIKILKNSLQFLYERAEKLASKEVLSETQRVTIKSDVIYNRIVHCVEHYEAILNYVKDIQSTFAPIVFLQFATSVFVICLSVLEITMIHPASYKFISVVIYILCILCQIFLYCYYGNELFYETSTLSQAIYLSKWYEYDQRAKKALLILMERSKRPLMISAATLFDLSLGTFTTILKRAYSVFAVLRNIND